MKAVLEQLQLQLLGLGDLHGFLELGGPVLVLVLGAGLLLWFLVFEHLLYLAFGQKHGLRQIERQWRARVEHHSWHARRVRQGLISALRQHAWRHFHLIKTLIALAPLLGLLGTVTGMLEVFDVLALTGAANPRALAAGISRATIPTMAGMVMALSGLYAAALLESWIKRRLRRIDNQLALTDNPNATP
ncbi:biopolymer transport protein ExbB [Thiorhodovibrio winogradskyi]|uniref:Biopolymer transport protein ExbB n=1 Tax=Thiorhodovibrio winogradskyi TaxID=77007 RepID=A0ABZ0SAP2_9GAMM|nr:MotA/TolQ/ExbB proton channel family protein [Thiorhodovibrio winogradskyi]